MLVFQLNIKIRKYIEVDSEIIEFEKWCKESWGESMRDNKLFFASNTPQIRQYADFENMKESLKMHIAEKLIFESCSRVGAVTHSGDLPWYIYHFAGSIKGDVVSFSGRMNLPLKAALLIIAYSSNAGYKSPPDRSDFDNICADGTALSAMYLMARLENLFRIRSRYLNEDGTLKKTIPKQLRQQLLKKYGVRRIGNNWKCNRINQSFIIFLYRNRTILGKRLRIMDGKLQIANRLDRIRNPAMHGELGDPGVEAGFLGLLIAIFYYGGLAPK